MRRDLVEQAQRGGRQAFATLAAESIDRLFNLAQLMLHDHDRADDAVQETLVEAWRDLPSLRDPGRFDAWLHRILVRSVYRVADRERRHSAATFHLRDAVSEPDLSGGVLDRDAIERAFRRLRPEHRAVLVLDLYLGMSDLEAAEVLDVPVGTLKSRLSRAKAALRAALDADARGGELAMESTR